MDVDRGTSESHALRGAIDVTKLDAFRDTFTGIEPMTSGAIDDRLDPRELRLTIPCGVADADETTFTVRWTTVNDYNIHYSDSADRNLRWDIHPHDYPRPPDDRHLHPPPEASSAGGDVAASCLVERSVDLVARAVHLLWRQVLDAESVADINVGTNYP